LRSAENAKAKFFGFARECFMDDVIGHLHLTNSDYYHKSQNEQGSVKGQSERIGLILSKLDEEKHTAEAQGAEGYEDNAEERMRR